MIIIDSIKEKKEKKDFLKEEMDRYIEQMRDTVPGTKEHDMMKNSYLELYKMVYPMKHISEKIIDVLKIVAPLGTSVYLGILAYNNNSQLKSKDGDVWREARRFK